MRKNSHYYSITTETKTSYRIREIEEDTKYFYYQGAACQIFGKFVEIAMTKRVITHLTPGVVLSYPTGGAREKFSTLFVPVRYGFLLSSSIGFRSYPTFPISKNL